LIKEFFAARKTTANTEPPSVHIPHITTFLQYVILLLNDSVLHSTEIKLSPSFPIKHHGIVKIMMRENRTIPWGFSKQGVVSCAEHFLVGDYFAPACFKTGHGT